MPRHVVTCALLVLSGCTVDREFLDTDLFTCSVSSECGDGWGCLRSTPYAVNFCAPDCDEACDGVCTGGEEPLCLRPCLIAEDGTPGECQSEDYACVRTSIERNEGVCYPVRTCVEDEECGANEVCLTDYLRTAAPDSTVPFDNLYCVPREGLDGTACPAGSGKAPYLPEGAVPICWPTCTVTDTRCPPAMACVTQLQQVGLVVDRIEGPQCDLGNYGLACQDDSNCFVGRCIDTGTAQGKICTLTCDQAQVIAGGLGCDGLIYPYSLQGLFWKLECDPAAPSSDDSGLCVLRYKIHFPNCTTTEGGPYPCASDLECRTLTFTEGSFNLCTKTCVTAEDCNAGLPTPLYGCVDDGTGQRICLLE